jgi:hypothetical protein
MPSDAVTRRRAPGRRRGPKITTSPPPSQSGTADDALTRLLIAAEASAPAGSAAKAWFARFLAGDAAEVRADEKKAG